MVNAQLKFRTLRPTSVAILLATVATVASLGPIASESAGAAALPNACAVLRTANPQPIVPGHVALGVFTAQHINGYVSCSVKVGALTIYLTMTKLPPGGSGGVSVKSMTQPAGLGVGDELRVGTLTSGGPYDEVSFSRAGVNAYLTANGAAPARLVALARRVYARI